MFGRATIRLGIGPHSSLRIYSPAKFSDGVQMANFSEFSSPVFSARRMQHISVMNILKAISCVDVW